MIVKGAQMISLDYMSSFTIVKDEIPGCKVATTYAGRPPVTFVTRVEGGGYNGKSWSCATYTEALVQHNKIVDMVKVGKYYR